MPVPGEHAEHRPAGLRLDPLDATGEQAEVAAEAVDDKAADALPLFLRHTGQGADDLGEHPAAVDVGHEQDRSVGVGGHAQVDDVAGHEVDLGAGAGTLHDDQVAGPAQPLQGGAALGKQMVLARVIGAARGLQPGSAVEHHLRALVAHRLEQHRVHVTVGRDPGRLGLNDLRPAHLQPLGRDPGIVRHVLGLERRHPQTPVGEDAAQGGGDHGFAHVRAGSEHGQAGGGLRHVSSRERGG